MSDRELLSANALNKTGRKRCVRVCKCQHKHTLNNDIKMEEAAKEEKASLGKANRRRRRRRLLHPPTLPRSPSKL